MKTDAIKLGAYRSCKLCGGRIIYWETAAKKLVPVDVEESPSGTVVLEIDASDRSRTLARVLGIREDHEGRKYVMHRETCAGARAVHAGEGVR